jgi:peptidyl-prolyl cis-trans isomerase D
MLTFFRRVSKSTTGTIIAAMFLIAILASFAISDISNFGSGTMGFGLGNSTLAKVGKYQVTDREMSDVMQRRLTQIRQQNPNATYADIARDFGPILDQLIDEKALFAFADKYGLKLSKRLIDAEIAQLPGVRSLNGQVTEQSYQMFLSQQRLTDHQVRQILSTSLFQRLLLLPVAANARIPIGVASPYAAMLLEARQGDAAVIPFTLFAGGLKPTDADLQRFYAANRARYMVPEQRVIRFARIGAEQVASIAATDKEVADYYNAHPVAYATREIRTISQAVTSDRKLADAIAARARGGATLAAAAAPAGNNVAVTTAAPDRQTYASVAGEQAAAAAFSAPVGGVIGPFQSEFGWVVAKVDSIKKEGGQSLAAARPSISQQITTQKRKQALDDLVDKVQNALDGGSSFGEAAAAAKLAVITTPPLIASGASRIDPKYAVPPELKPALKTGFEMAPNDEAEVVSLQNGQAYAMVAPAEIVPAAPAPLASIRDRVTNDWVRQQAIQRARAAASAIQARASGNVLLADAVKQSGTAVPVRTISARRIEIAQANGPVPPAFRALFSLGEGKAALVPDAQGRGFYVVKVTRIVPGNALLQPTLIGQVRNEMQRVATDDYAAQFMAAIRAHLNVRRNDKAIAALKQRILSNGS